MRVQPTLFLLILLLAAAPEVACQISDSVPSKRPLAPSSQASQGDGDYQAGDAVMIEWQGGWYRGHVLEAEGERYKVHYDGYSDSWDEWVEGERLRRVESVDEEPTLEEEEPALEVDMGGQDAGTAETSSHSLPAEGASPPLGKYVCRQYMTTMGYLTLRPGGVYEVSGVTGRYRYDAGTGEVGWLSGSYADWNWRGRYEHVSRPAGDGRPDEDIIRLTSEADGLRIACYKMAED